MEVPSSRGTPHMKVFELGILISLLVILFEVGLTAQQNLNSELNSNLAKYRSEILWTQ